MSMRHLFIILEELICCERIRAKVKVFYDMLSILMRIFHIADRKKFPLIYSPYGKQRYTNNLRKNMIILMNAKFDQFTMLSCGIFQRVA